MIDTDDEPALHVAAYHEILASRGFGIADALPSIELVEKLRDGK